MAKNSRSSESCRTTSRRTITASSGSRRPGTISDSPSPNDPREMRIEAHLDAWARLNPGVPRRPAQMSALARRLEQQYPECEPDTGIALASLREEM